MEIEHFSHQHLLSLSEKKRDDKALCDACWTYCVGPTYSCRESYRYFDLHESCAKLPQELHTPLHPHPLILHPRCHFNCFACARYFNWGFTFCCDKCDFNLDIKCAFIRPARAERDDPVRTPFSHKHQPLVRFDKIPADRFNCFACGTYCSDTIIYGCFPCRFFLHPSCFNLPQEIIFHPFHPYHPLTLLPVKVRRRCNACREETHGFFYVCQYNNCSFCLHIECSVILTAVTSDEGHDHLLQFSDNIGDELIKCSACNSTCESYAFRCLDLDCDFNLHHACGPLPYTIKHKSHIHPLIITHSLAVHEDETHDEFYCDACEEERDPFLPIYYCAECHFVAEISCVISEVISSLNGEYGDVELTNPLGQFGKVITKDAVKEMMQNIEKQLKPTLIWCSAFETSSEVENEGVVLLEGRILEDTITDKEIVPYDHDEIIMYSDKAYTQFMEFLNHSEVSHNKFPYDWDFGSRTKEEVVNVGDYMTTRKLAPILYRLLSNHGDIGVQSTLSPKWKSFYFCMFCECIDRMRNTKVVDITDDILLGWWRCLKILQFTGFKIEFAYDRLKRVTNVHFGLYVEKEVDNALDQLDTDIEKLSLEVEAMKCKRDRVIFEKSTKSSLNIQECLREASVLKNGKAVTSRLL